MKKFIFLLTILFNLSRSNAQCKVETDPFTKDLLAKFNYTGVNSIAIGNNLNYPPFELFYDLKNGEGIMGFTYSYLTALGTSIPKGGDVLFKLENDEILKFVTSDDAAPKVFVFNEKNWTKYEYKFKVSASDVEKLSTLKVVLVRFPDASKQGNVDCSDYMKAIKKGAECVVKK